MTASRIATIDALHRIDFHNKTITPKKYVKKKQNDELGGCCLHAAGHECL
jgi:hypothetical protein